MNRKRRGIKMKKKKSTILFLISVFVVGILAYSGFQGLKIGDYRFKPFTETINKGLDLQGGISVLEEIQGEKVSDKDMSTTIELITMRTNKMGVSETLVVQEGSNRIRIEIPGKFDQKEVLDTVAKSGVLKFVGPDDVTILTGTEVKDASTSINQDNQPVINLELNESGKEKFAVATKKFLGQPITIFMDDVELTSPTVNDIITDGKAEISGTYTLEEATRQAQIIKSGALPVTLKAVSVKTVGATLGKNALPLSMKAGAIGILFILLFMLLYYRAPGIIADISLILYVVLVLGTFSALNVTLTLAGIAAFLLTVGMAVDANVLIFERIKEELRTGKSIKSAVDSGFHKALSSILDANITTIIAAVVLYSVGTGAVKGFALTLMIGITLSVFTAFTSTRYLLKLAVGMGLLSKTSHFGVKRDAAKSRKPFKIVEKTKIWFAISLLIIVIGMGAMAKNGLNLGIDFKGGTKLDITMNQAFIKADADKIIDKSAKGEYTSKTVDDGNDFEVIVSDALSADEIATLQEEIKAVYKSSEFSQDYIGGSIGSELKSKALIGLIAATICMLVYIGIRFEFKFGFAAVTALVHDILITLGVYAIFSIPVNSPFIAAILTIVGYSINDTIVVFDRIRENNNGMRKSSIEDITNTSITQTLARSINTVATTLFTIVAVYVFVPAIRELSLPLIIGILVGCYSSIFIASPTWVLLKKRRKKVSKKAIA
ncbi:MAG: protein translocase subunit SecF [Clostridium sp.]|nr:protein translocase subunit SecF [Clostridium sp.]